MIKYGKSNNSRISGFVFSLYLFGAFGAASVLIDLDHIPLLVEKGLPITAQNLITQAGRPLHLPLVILLGAVCIYLAACVYRLRDSAL